MRHDRWTTTRWVGARTSGSGSGMLLRTSKCLISLPRKVTSWNTSIVARTGVGTSRSSVPNTRTARGLERGIMTCAIQRKGEASNDEQRNGCHCPAKKRARAFHHQTGRTSSCPRWPKPTMFHRIRIAGRTHPAEELMCLLSDLSAKGRDTTHNAHTMGFRLDVWWDHALPSPLGAASSGAMFAIAAGTPLTSSKVPWYRISACVIRLMCEPM